MVNGLSKFIQQLFLKIVPTKKHNPNCCLFEVKLHLKRVSSSTWLRKKGVWFGLSLGPHFVWKNVQVKFIFLSRTPQLVFANFPRTSVQNSCFWKLVNGFYFCAKRKFFFLCGLTNRSLRNNEWKKEAGQKQNREHNRKVTWTNFRKTVAYEQQNISSKSFGQRSQKGFFDSSSFWKITGNFFFHFSFSPILFSWEDCY